MFLGVDNPSSLVLALGHWAVDKNSFKGGSGQGGFLLWDKELFRTVSGADLSKPWKSPEQDGATDHMSKCRGRRSRSQTMGQGVLGTLKHMENIWRI